ncbi:MAG: glycoside hydrolase family 95 protein [Bacteroidota bacterium]|nr:glycoside hydrolase family 95 protein [Bacteroidota bacterium]
MRKKNKDLLALMLGCMLFSFTRGQQALRLWYRQPAAIWEACVPLGNGRLGAMPDGGINNETTVLNDITLWSGGAQDADDPGAGKYLAPIRQLLQEGKNDEAQELMYKTFICKGAGSGEGNGANKPYGSYQVLGNLHLQFDYGQDSSLVKAENYIRDLSLPEAVAHCRYTVNGVTFDREYFTSFTDDVIIIRLTASRKGMISLKAGLDRPERYRTRVDGKELQMEGRLNNGTDGKGMRYLTRIRMKLDGGSLSSGDSVLRVEHANAVTIYISSGTDFRDSSYKEKTAELIRSAMQKPYAAQKAAHIKKFQSLFNRAGLELRNSNVNSGLPTDERLDAFKNDPSDIGLAALYFQYGRYLAISSTRAGLLPPNLQGLWANTVQSPWNGDYHLDINIQMNHWPIEEANLPMLNQPYYALVKQLVAPGEKTAATYYHAKGWVAHAITNVWGYTSPGEYPSWGATNIGSGWICNDLWEHYAFTNNKTYLEKTYPILRASAAFYLSSMIRENKHGWLVTAPSNSPENSFLLPNGKEAAICMGPTIDNQIIRELFAHVADAAVLLKKDAAFAASLKKASDQLPPNQIAPDGRLMEWLENYKETEPHHRHVSHLWGLYPGNEITPAQTPELAKAVKASLEGRGDQGTGWSLAWKTNLWARLQDGNHAYQVLRDLLKPTVDKGFNMVDGGGSYPNLFCGHPPYQIDGNFGGCAGIVEMLIQSNSRAISLLPALPDQWAEGSFHGLCARGGVEISANWENNKINSCTLKATSTNHFLIRIPRGVLDIRSEKNNSASWEKDAENIRCSLAKGEAIKFIFIY